MKSMDLSLACGERSRPEPDPLRPPKDVVSDERSHVLTQAARARIAHDAVPVSRLHTAKAIEKTSALDLSEIRP